MGQDNDLISLRRENKALRNYIEHSMDSDEYIDIDEWFFIDGKNKEAYNDDL